MSKRNRTVNLQVRLTKTEHERLLNLKAMNGFRSLSEYVRYSLLGNSFTVEKMVREIHDRICREKTHKKN